MARGQARRLTVALVVWLGAAIAGAASARAQDRGPEPEDGRPGPRDRSGPGASAVPARERETPPAVPDAPWRGAPPSSYDPQDEAPPPDAPLPRSHAAPRASPIGPEAPRPAPPDEEAVKVKLDGKIRLELGYDSNVFRAQRGRQGDAFFHGAGEGSALVTLPGDRELFASLQAEGYDYFHQGLADEMYATGFLAYDHPLSSVFDIEVQNTLEYSRQNFYTDNGDLLPREKYNAYDEEGRALLIAHATDDLSFEMGAGARWVDTEETFGIPSLDFWEVRGDAGARYKIPWWSGGKAKLRYTFRERRYLQLPANDRDGSQTPSDPRLELRRHQLRATYAQKADGLGLPLSVVLGYSFTYNQDTFENDRSYRENSASARLELWAIPEWTRFELEVRGGERRFLVRRTLQGRSLRQDFVEATGLVWQKLHDHLALVGEAGWFLYGSSDPREGYGRLVVQLGVEASW